MYFSHSDRQEHPVINVLEPLAEVQDEGKRLLAAAKIGAVFADVADLPAALPISNKLVGGKKEITTDHKGFRALVDPAVRELGDALRGIGLEQGVINKITHRLEKEMEVNLGSAREV